MRTIIFFLLAISLGLLHAGDAQEYTLKNGMKVLVKEDHRAPVAVVMLWYKVGSADEHGGRTGLSHALEHMMFKGTPRFPKGVFSKTIAASGGQENAFTNNDYTAYFEKIAASELDTALKLEADRMQGLLLEPAEFEKEIKVIQEERRMRTDDNPQSLTFERFLSTAHLSSPYHHPVIGWMSDLEQMDVTDLRHWYERFYAPNNATLVVVGDVDAKTVFAMSQKYFSHLKPKTLPAIKLQPEPPQLGKRHVEVHLPAQLPMLIMGYTVPGLKTAQKPKDAYALELIAGILDAGDSARFTKHLVRKQQIAADVSTYYNLFSRYDTQFVIYGVPTQKYSSADLELAIIQELKKLKNQPVPETELSRVKNQIIAQKTFEKDSIFGQAMELGLLETVGLGWQMSKDYQQHIKEVTPADIQHAAKTYFDDKRLTTANLIPLQPEAKS